MLARLIKFYDTENVSQRAEQFIVILESLIDDRNLKKFFVLSDGR